MRQIMNQNSSTTAITFLALCLAGTVLADENSPEPTQEGVKFFETRIRPVLIDQCYRCHSSEGQGVRGGLAVDSRESLLIGGESGPA